MVEMEQVVRQLKEVARQALKGLPVVDNVEGAIAALEKNSDLFDPVMIQIMDPIPDIEFAGLVVFTFLQL